MPELVNNSDGSLPGINELLGTIVCPLLAKKFKKASRIWAHCMGTFRIRALGKGAAV
jgi:hypothetical protein